MLLRRPFSIHRAGKGKLEVLYAVVGEGTRLLSQKKPGKHLDVIGPLGNGFDYERRTTNDERLILVAGGMGVAPLIFLAEKLGQRSKVKGQGKPLVLLGAGTKKQVLCEKEFKQLGCEVMVATDDGSVGFKGKVTDLLKDFLRPTSHVPRPTVYACGPRPMLRALSRISLKNNIPAQISLEEHMSCGIGACMGCVVDTLQGFKRVCKEGPVFDAGQILW